MPRIAPYLLCAALLAASHVDADVLAPGTNFPYPGTAPHYHSGTNCRASAIVICDPATEPVEILEARLYVAGTLVSSWENPDPLNGGHAIWGVVGLEARFSSTHFPNLSNIRVRMEATDTLGREYEGHYDAPAKNVAAVWQQGEFSSSDGPQNSAPLVTSYLETLMQTGTDLVGWTGHSIMGNLDESAVIYVNAHGDGGIFAHHEDDDPSGAAPVYSSSNVPSEANYLDGRDSNNGSGLTPFNSTNSPPTTLFFLDACKASETNKFTTIFYPYQDQYGEIVIDQAQIGWSVFVDLYSSVVVAELIWSALVLDSETIWQARYEFLTWNVENGVVKYQDGQQWVEVTSITQMPIWGDHYTRIAGVYTGDNSHATDGWFRPL